MVTVVPPQPVPIITPPKNQPQGQADHKVDRKDKLHKVDPKVADQEMRGKKTRSYCMERSM